GLENFRFKEVIKFDKETDHPAEKPAAIVAPFATWRLALIGEEAGIAGGRLEPYKVNVAGEEVEVKPVLPAVALGEKVAVYLPVQSNAKIDGSARFVVDGTETERSISIQGTGTYLIRKDRLEYRYAPAGELPVALSCWVDAASALTCQGAEA